MWIRMLSRSAPSRRWLVIGLAGVFAGIASGQNSIDRLNRFGQPTPPEAQPQTPPGPMGDMMGGQLQLPDWVTPGLRVVYQGMASTEAPPTPVHHRPGDPLPTGSAAFSRIVFDVHLVADAKLFGSMSSLLQLGTNQNQHVLAGGQDFVATQQDVMVTGAGFFIHPSALTTMQSGEGTEVVRGPYPINGQQVQAVTITIRGQDFVSQRVYEVESGLMLAERNASGPLRRGEQHNEFNRQSHNASYFLGMRQIDGPWRQGAWPEWTQRVEEIRFQGQMTSTMAGFSHSMPFQSTVKITERGPNWARGTNEMHMTVDGMGPQTSQEPFALAQGAIGGYWISPQALANTPPGVIDRDPHTGSVLSYQRQGHQGVFKMETTGGGTATSAYNLQDGALEHVTMTMPHVHQRVELRATGRR